MIREGRTRQTPKPEDLPGMLRHPHGYSQRLDPFAESRPPVCLRSRDAKWIRTRFPVRVFGFAWLTQMAFAQHPLVMMVLPCCGCAAMGLCRKRLRAFSECAFHSVLRSEREDRLSC